MSIETCPQYLLRDAMASIVAEHRRLVTMFVCGDIGAIEREIEEQIRGQALDVDHRPIIADRRAAMVTG